MSMSRPHIYIYKRTFASMSLSFFMSWQANIQLNH